MRHRLHIFDLGMERYVERLREAEEVRLVNRVKKQKRPAFHTLPFLKLRPRSH